MPKPEKVATVAEIAERFRSSQGAVLTEYRGLTVAQITQLRRSIGSHATYAVVKNTLTALAAKQAGVTAFDGQLSGPTAVAFVTGDPVEAARGLRDFARAHPALVIKAGLLEGKALSADEVRQLADLEPREVLLAKLAGAMKASLSNAVSLFAAPLSQAVRTVDALRQKVETEGGAAAPAEAPAAAEPAETAEPAAAADDAPAGEPDTAEPDATEPTEG
ncbi:MAG TPA: 50S ribosomal protein L10 [Myxococcaceae bacterium]|nr:50S ribosomal protein L10 [Myxococcaceae bacterium]